MPSLHQNRDVANLQIQLITTILKLVKHGMPITALWYYENEVKTYGSKHLKEFTDAIDKAAIDKAIKEDVFHFASPAVTELVETEESIPEKVKAKQVFQQFYSNKEPDELPFPLSCMNKKEKITWLTKQILQEQREKSGEILTQVWRCEPYAKLLA